MDISRHQEKCQTDIPRLRAGGVDAQFFAVYVPSETARTGEAASVAREQFDLIERMIERYPDAFALARTADDVERLAGSARIAVLIGVEGGHTIENSLDILAEFHERGARYLGLTHTESIDWADSSTDEARHGGLTAFGEKVLLEMNRLGMLVDLAHTSVDTMRHALRVSRAPVIFSHACTSAVAPHARNVPDDVLRLLADKKGVIMVAFFSGYLHAEGARAMEHYFVQQRVFKESYPDDPAEYEKEWNAWREAHPIPAGTVADVVDHIDHVVNLCGIDHVGLGADYDGARKWPVHLEDVSGYPYITQELLNRGYSEPDIRKILGGNLLRVLRDAERVAREWETDCPPSNQGAAHD
jgi:membrane dipeptidase